jgi:hypothetical protein
MTGAQINDSVWDRVASLRPERKPILPGAFSVEAVSTGIFLRSSGRIGFRKVTDRTGGYIFDPATGESVKVTDSGYLLDADRKEEIGLLRPPTGDLATIAAVDLKGGRHAPLLRAEHWNIYQAHFSSDDRWIAFLANIGPDAFL